MSIIDDVELQHLLTTYDGYAKRQKPNYDLQQFSQTQNIPALEELLRAAEEETFLLDKVISQSSQLYRHLYQAILELKDKQFKLQEKLKTAHLEVETHKDQVSTLKKEKQSILKDQIHQREQYAALAVKTSEIEKNYLAEIKELKEDRQRQDLKLDNLVNNAVQLEQQNSGLNKLINDQKDEQNELKQKLEQAKKQIEQLEAQTIKLKDQLDWEFKKRENLQEEIKEKERASVHLTEEIMSLKEVLKHPFDQYDYDIEDLAPFQKHFSKEDMAKEKLLLSEDIVGGMDQFYDHKRELSEKKNSSMIKYEMTDMGGVSKATSHALEKGESGGDLSKATSLAKPLEKTKSRKLGMVDPYYCHFLLLSQSIKISENREHYYNLDIKPFYLQIIGDKVPMHEWPTWIKNKFEQLAANEQGKRQENGKSKSKDKGKGKNSKKQQSKEQEKGLGLESTGQKTFPSSQ